MLFLYSLLSVLAYSLHNVLMAPLYREINDKLAVVFYRGICISISFSPLLLLVPRADLINISRHLPAMFLASALAVIGTWAAIKSVNSLAIGVANTLLSTLSNLFIILVSVLLLGEVLSIIQYLLIALILGTVLVFGLSRSQGNLPSAYNPLRGMFFCLIFAVFTGAGLVLLGMLSRESSPILTGYLWESLIGLFAGAALIGRSLLNLSAKTKGGFRLIPFRTLGRVFLCSAPTGAGTSCYAFAMAEGSIAIASAALNLCMVVTAILAVLMYGEKLSGFQWSLLILISIFVVGLRL